MGWGGDGKGQGKGGAKMEIKDPAKVIWMGGVPAGTHFKELLGFVQQVIPTAKWAQVVKTTAAVGFATEEDAATAAASLNGASFNGATLETDMWTGKKTSGSKGGGKGKSWGGGQAWGGGGGQVWKSQFQKSWGGDSWGGDSWSKGKGKGQSRGPRIQDPTKAVWVGNIPEGIHYKDVLALAKSVSGDAKWAEVFKGSAAIGFSSEEAAAAAAISLNGAMLGSSSIVADSWVGKNKQAV